MARALGRKKAAREKPTKAAGAGRKGALKPESKSKKRISLPVSSSKTKQMIKMEKSAARGGSVSAESQKQQAAGKIPVATEKPRGVLNESKSTAAALALLEKGIKLIHQRDFKKARHELNALLETYPKETEIVARTRTYIQICDREESSQKKPAISNDQLYGMGVLHHNRGNYDQAVAYFRQSLEKHQNADYIYYSLAASLALRGDRSGSIQNLKKAIELNEDNRVYVKNDSDFLSLHTNKEFAELVGMIPPPADEPAQ
jgi:tetratricopeptide (TPR) repeat protein